MSKKFMETTSCIEERKGPEYGHVTYVLATIAIYFCTLHFAVMPKTKQNKTKKGAQVEPKQISRSLNLSRSSKAERISVIIRKSCEIA